MTVQGQFWRGARRLTLQGNYVIEEFIPPGINPSYNVAVGPSANRTGGGTLIGAKYNNRTATVSLWVYGGDEQAIEANVRRVEQFVKIGDEALFFAFSPNGLPEPLYGQFGAPLRYEVVSAVVSVGNLYAVDPVRGRGLPVMVRMEVKPFALGKKQRLVSACGGIFEDAIGAADGCSRGVAVAEATTNKMTNPVFGHATWNNGWISGPNIIVLQNTDDDFLLPGTSNSAEITGRAGGTFYQSINVGNTNIHTVSFYAKRSDGGELTAADCAVHYGVDKTTSFLAIGDGWYRARWSGAGVNAATNSGITVFAGRHVFVTGFQIEEKSYATPLCWGDLLGCSWASTAHASTSTRAKAYLYGPLAGMLNIAEGSISLTWRTDVAVPHSGNLLLFDTRDAGHTTSLHALLNVVDSKIYLSDSVQSAVSSAQTIAAGEVINLVMTWGRNGLYIYKNGSETLASQITYTVPTPGANVWIGSDYLANAQLMGIIMGFTVYDRQLSQFEAFAVGNASLAVANAGGRVDSEPWLWTKDGDNQVDNCNDSSRDNWAVAGGVGGSAPAETLFDCNLSGDLSTVGSVYLSNLAHEVFINPANFYDDYSGTVDANSSGGAYSQSLAPTSYPDNNFFYVNQRALTAIAGRTFYGFVRFADDGSGTTIRPYYGLGGSAHYGETVSFSATATFSLVITPPMQFPPAKSFYLNDNLLSNPLAAIGCFITRTGGTANWRRDYFTALFDKIARIDGGDNGGDGFILEGMNLQDYTVSSREIGGNDVSLSGDIIELEPNQVNHLMSLIGDETHNPVISYTMTYTIFVTPRWGLL